MAAITAAASCSSCLAASNLSSVRSRASAKPFAPVLKVNAIQPQKTVRCQAKPAQEASNETFKVTRREALAAAAAVLGLSQLPAPVQAQEDFVQYYGKAGKTRCTTNTSSENLQCCSLKDSVDGIALHLIRHVFHICLDHGNPGSL
jgi:hypothetical protein